MFKRRKMEDGERLTDESRECVCEKETRWSRLENENQSGNTVWQHCEESCFLLEYLLTVTVPKPCISSNYSIIRNIRSSLNSESNMTTEDLR